jgi:hypothetical protein
MSQLKKKMERLQKRDGPPIGFGKVVRDQPAAMLLGVVAGDAKATAQALEAGADFAVVRAPDAKAAAGAVKQLVGEGACIGAWLESLDESGAQALREAGCDFVICTLEGTVSAAVDSDKMGHVLAIPPEGLEDSTLRALGPLGLDALLYEGEATGLTLAGQLQLVRLAAFSSTPLLVVLGSNPSASDFRTLRDSGCGAVVVSGDLKPNRIQSLVEALKSVPPPRRARRDSPEVAIVPSMAAHAEHEEGDDDE